MPIDPAPCRRPTSLLSWLPLMNKLQGGLDRFRPVVPLSVENLALEQIVKTLLLSGFALFLSACGQQKLVSQPATAPQARGYALASASCAACHGIERNSVLSPNPAAPSFPSIVNQEGLSAQTLSYWLRNAHNYPAEMDFELDPAKTDDLVEYMLTLRDPNYIPVG